MNKCFLWIRNKINDAYRMSQVRLFTIVVTIVIIPIVMITGVSFSMITNQAKDRYVYSLNMEAKQLANTLSAELGNLLSLGRMIIADDNIKNLIGDYRSGALSYEDAKRELNGCIGEYEDTSLMASALVSKIALITREKVVFGNEITEIALRKAEFCNEIEALYDVNRNVKWTSDSEIFKKKSPNNADSFYLMLSMRDSKTFRTIATVVLQLQTNVLASSILPNMYSYQTAAIVNDSGKLIVDLDYLDVVDDFERWISAESIYVLKGSSWEKMVDGAQYVISNYPISKSDWNIIVISNTDSYTRLRQVYIRNVLLAVGVILMLSFFSAFRLSKRFMKPVVDLNRQMKLVKEGNLDVYLEPYSNDEIGELTLQFNDMVKNIKHLLELNRREQEEKRISDMKFLQMQINPHFIYNTMTMLRYSVSMGDRKQADRIIMALNSILHYALSDNNQFVTLNRALEWMHNYLLIVDCTLAEPVKVDYRLAEGTGDCQIIRMLIQPILENAAFHGLKKCQGSPKLRISAEIVDDELTIGIWDNGPGFDTDKFKAERVDTDRESIGIANVNQRIRLYYGEKYGVRYRSFREGLDIGTEAVILLPVIRRNDGDVLIDEYKHIDS